MNDQLKWDLASKAVCGDFDRLPAHVRSSLLLLVEQIMQLKEELLRIALAAGSACICGECGGRCCLHGKYHFSVLDLMAYLFTHTEPLTPLFGKEPFCPYGDAAGCMMKPAFRPVTCVIFNCEHIDDKVTGAEREDFHRCEQQLREAVLKAGQIMDMRVSRPLLLTVEDGV